jgi:glycosyltransferase involved in cell wall biosynthesis
VLEALALGVPVVACENGTRPEGVVTYPAEDADRMAAAVLDVLERRSEVRSNLAKIELPDTVSAEVELLTA